MIEELLNMAADQLSMVLVQCACFAIRGKTNIPYLIIIIEPIRGI